VSDKLVLDPERAIELINGEEDYDYEFIDSEYAGEWRWGVSYEVIIKDKETGKLWGTVYREQVGDNYYNSLEDEAWFYPYEAYEKTVTEYRRIKQ
jgi:hypothetical protein